MQLNREADDSDVNDVRQYKSELQCQEITS